MKDTIRATYPPLSVDLLDSNFTTDKWRFLLSLVSIGLRTTRDMHACVWRMHQTPPAVTSLIVLVPVKKCTEVQRQWLWLIMYDEKLLHVLYLLKSNRHRVSHLVFESHSQVEWLRQWEVCSIGVVMAWRRIVYICMHVKNWTIPWVSSNIPHLGRHALINTKHWLTPLMVIPRLTVKLPVEQWLMLKFGLSSHW